MPPVLINATDSLVLVWRALIASTVSIVQMGVNANTNPAIQGGHKSAPAKIGRCRHPAAVPGVTTYSDELTAPAARSNAPKRADRSHGRLKAIKRPTANITNVDTANAKPISRILSPIFDASRK